MNNPHEQQAAAMSRAGELADDEQLRECINSGQVSAAQAAIHYPECWDTAAYPTFGSALSEVTAWFECSKCEPKNAQIRKAVAHAEAEELPLPNKMLYESYGGRQRWVVAGKAVPPRAVPYFTSDQMRAYATAALAAERAEMARLREALIQGEALINGDLTGLEWKVECRKFLVTARAALGLYQGATNHD